MIKLKFKDIHSNPYVLSELILTAKIMRKMNFKIQMLAGNTLKIGVGASFEISMTLVGGWLMVIFGSHHNTYTFAFVQSNMGFN